MKLLKASVLIHLLTLCGFYMAPNSDQLSNVLINKKYAVAALSLQLSMPSFTPSLLAIAALLVVALTWGLPTATLPGVGIFDFQLFSELESGQSLDDVCPQPSALSPIVNKAVWANATRQFEAQDFKTRVVQLLGGTVQIPTITFDDMQAVGTDPRWEVFKSLHAYLKQAFPLAHSHLTLRKINTYALWYEWKGTDASLKPIFFAAHQDVVPVDPLTESDWAHPPFSGFFDGDRIWGRGSADDKNGLIGVLTALEILLEANFSPSRTIVAAFGFDEEISGFQGAEYLSKALLQEYGPNGFAFIVDEGPGMVNMFDTLVALPGVTEKGYIDITINVTSPGGHSSNPPSHTSIGVLSALVVQYENNPNQASLSRDSVPFQTFQCLAEHTLSIPPPLKSLIQNSMTSDESLHALESVLGQDPLYRSQISTTTAVDVIRGGVKANALPELATVIINHRILAERGSVNSVAEVRDDDTKLLKPVANSFNISFSAFGVPISTGSAAGNISLGNVGQAFDSAPITPAAAAYDLLAGTIVSTYNTRLGHSSGDDKTVVVSPTIMPANTDTRHYWDLTPNIFRYGHGNTAGLGLEGTLNGIHSVNESIDANDFVEMIRFFALLALNADEWGIIG
ncbi:Carboxypeptidase S [Mycena indigotica]|uniref:Carboxypeptidase S n=1 Tax=Mycena indigotica TaxID=2126181 RepID=A0A8H6T6S3_9AGAR|nr:Carboxypeptidase S [Mycena indigotica]KAF7311976.1 Carboxypeptidase S [Mycena indigotica]